jgi:hypothetical protein
MEATLEQAVEGLAIVQVLSTVLDRLVGANAAIARADPGQVTKFHANNVPEIAIQQYLERYVSIHRCRMHTFDPMHLFVLILTLHLFRFTEFSSTRRARTNALFSPSSTLIA